MAEIKLSTVDKRIHAIIAGAVLVFSFLLMIILIKFSVPESHKDIAIYILGAITAWSTQIISYYFGSSKGQDDTNEARNSKL